jgi:adenylate cyclase
VFDVLFLEQSAYGVYDDESLGRAAAENGRVVGALYLGSEQGSTSRWPAGIPEPQVTVSGLEQWLSRVRRADDDPLSMPKAAFPIPELATGARSLASAVLVPDRVDGVYRRGNLFSMFDGRVVPSEALAAYVTGNPDGGALRIRPGLLEVGARKVPIDAEGRAVLRFRGPTRTHGAYRAAAVIRSELRIREGLAPEVDPAELRDRYVFFGFSAPGLFDLKPAPVAGAYPGVEIHATMLDNLLSGDFMRTVPRAGAVLLLLALCAGAGIAASGVSGFGKSALVYALFVLVAPAVGLAAFALGWWVEIVPLELGTVIALAGSSLAGYAAEGREKRFIKSTFGRYLSPLWIEELIANPERAKLGGERRELSMFFSDLQGFTSISETLRAEELTALINDYLSVMTEIIQDEGGTVDKYVGDAIVAFWNAPLTQADHALRAVRAALRCQSELAGRQPEFRARAGKDLLMRVGLNSGVAAVGNMGSRVRLSYTMMGDEVNLASRLEGINKYFGTYTMASAAVMQRIGGAFPARELARVAVVGKREAITVHEPMTAEQFAVKSGVLRVFAQGLQAFYAGRFEEAAEVFARIAGEDPPAAAYAVKCRQLASSPPGGEWNGVWVMTSK